uniref:Uncharacterized protein n=1 Tax=Anguilla anguilla TaxID=7936 RepID=A0A0E9PEX5_ANGAN
MYPIVTTTAESESLPPLAWNVANGLPVLKFFEVLVTLNY